MSRMKRLSSVLVAFTMVGAVAVGAVGSVSSTGARRRRPRPRVASGPRATRSRRGSSTSELRATPVGPTPTTSGALRFRATWWARPDHVPGGVPEGPQCSQVVSQLVDAGANIIFATSYGYQPELIATAKQSTRIFFEQATGTTVKPRPCRSTTGRARTGTSCREWQPGSIGDRQDGFVAPYPIPEVIRESTPSPWGTQLMNPKATIKVIWTNAWFGPATERTAAQALVAAGVDALADGQDSPTTGQVAEAHGLKWTGYDSNQESFAPKAWLTATTYNWGPYYIQEVKAAMNGTWKSGFWYGSLADHFVIMAPFGPSVTQATRKAILAKEAAIVKGTFDPFTGPITEQNGTIGVKAGVTLTVMQKYSLSWFVKGVIGNPKG